MLRPAIVAISKVRESHRLAMCCRGAACAPSETTHEASLAQDTALSQKRPRSSIEKEEEPPVKSLGLLAQYGSDEDDT
jgi:hypothetical protein